MNKQDEGSTLKALEWLELPMMKLWIYLIAVLLLTACGQSGDLFIPKDEAVINDYQPIKKP